jgi:hypothetical protein
LATTYKNRREEPHSCVSKWRPWARLVADRGRNSTAIRLLSFVDCLNMI